MTVGEDGQILEERVVGSPTIETRAGGEWSVTTTDLVSPEGEVFGIDWDAGQESEDAPLVVTLTVRRFDELAPSAESLREVWDAQGETAPTDFATWEQGIASSGAANFNRPQTVNPGLETWIVEAGRDEVRTLVLQVATFAEFAPPPALDGLLDSDPVAYLNRLEERTLARIDYQNEVEGALEPLARALEAEGHRVLHESWVDSAIYVEATPETALSLIDDGRFSHVGWVQDPESDNNDGAEVRASTQVEQFLTAGFNGETPSGMTARDDIFVVVADDCIDEDHPAWRDDPPFFLSRLTSVWRWDASFRLLTSAEDSATGPCHGMGVSGILMANLLEGQDPTNRSTTAEREQSTGNATDAVFEFIERVAGPSGRPYFSDVGAKVIALEPDVFSMSYSTGGACDVDASDNQIIDNIYANGTFVAKSGANNFHFVDSCSVDSPGTAAGAFVAGALEESGVPDLNAGPLESSSPIGGDPHGRAIVDLVAPGRQTSGTPKWNDTYKTDGPFDKTSAAAPTIGGAAAVLKDHLVNVIGSSWANDVGNLHATMLLMGDGTTLTTRGPFNPNRDNPGPAATAGDAMDPAWGAGRMRMRMFTDDGMDAPWRARWCTRTVTTGGVIAPCLANPDAAGVNQPLPGDVERLRATAFWFEPNLGSVEDAANVAFAAYRNGLFQYQTAGTAPGEKRLREDAAGGNAWDVRLIPWCVPPSGAIFDASNPFANCSANGNRYVHIALYWEDMDRDDGGLPPDSIK